MVDIQLRKRALTKAGYEAVYNEAMKGYHLRLPDGTYLSEHWTGLPDWFAAEDLAWRAAPAVETSLDLALAVLLDGQEWAMGTVAVVIGNGKMLYWASIGEETSTNLWGDTPARATCEAYLFCELEAA